MTFCCKYDTRFSGPGRYCEWHHRHDGRDKRYPYNAYEHFNYNSDSTDPTGVHMRANQRNQHRRTRFVDEYDGNQMYDFNSHHASRNNYNIRGGYDHQAGVVRYGRGTSKIDTSLHQPLVHTFNTLSRTHAIKSMTYNVSPRGDRSVTAEANTEREMCHICKDWFPDHEKLEYHQREFSAGCEEHRKCMRPEDAMYHATKERHDRCFVRGCHTVYRREGDWKSWAIVEHIRKTHGY